MLGPVIITPVILPEMPDPSTSDCETLLTYANNLICSLKDVQTQLNGVSASPDEALLTIRKQVSNMLSKAEGIKGDLNSIKTEATRKANLNSSNTVI